MRHIKADSYIGHSSQLSGIKEYRLIGGKGDGMRQLEVQNGCGMQMIINLDRAADIEQLWLKGDNLSYISAVGHVAPSYYDDRGAGFIKSFTGGLLTTCGLQTIGKPSIDNGEELPLHGRVGNTPCEYAYWVENDENFVIHAFINQATVFGAKLYLKRTIQCSKTKNCVSIKDEIENRGDTKEPIMIMYHMNMGYPLLSEESEVFIPSKVVKAADERADEGLEQWNKMIPPTANFKEQCYFHEFDERGLASIYNSRIQKGLVISFDATNLDTLTEWKMMGIKDYVLGLEPGNCIPKERNTLREEGQLKYIEAFECVTYEVDVTLIEGESSWNSLKQEFQVAQSPQMLGSNNLVKPSSQSR